MCIRDRGRTGVGVVQNDPGTIKQLHLSRTGKGTEKAKKKGDPARGGDGGDGEQQNKSGWREHATHVSPDACVA